MSDESTERDLTRTADKLSQVSPSFCLAKWLQVTLHLHNGHTHSCHHPNTHKVPLRELNKSETALHNTSFKKTLRKEMLEGKRPHECGYCWNIEDTPGNHFSDRIIKSNDSWAAPHFSDALQASWRKNINPTYVEVSFSHACNFRCAYCTPSISSKWEAEIKKFGDYPTLSTHHSLEEAKRQKKQPYPIDAPNPYVDAFWKWWPNLYKDLRVFRITGGEPLLVNDTYRVLDWLLENPNPKMELALNSNLSVPDKKLETFISKSKQLLDKGGVDNFVVFTSLDTWGKASEYIRFGLDLEVFKRNVERVLSAHPKVFMTFMCTYSLLSVPDFKGLLDYICELKERYPNPVHGGWPRVTLDISYLRHPEFFIASLLPQNLHYLLDRDFEHMLAAKTKDGKPAFSVYETNKLKRLISFAKRPLPQDRLLELKKDFAIFFHEYDRRRGTEFVKTFPILKELFDECTHLVKSDLKSRHDFAEKDLERSTIALRDAREHLREAKIWHERASREIKRSEENLNKLSELFKKTN